MFKNKKSILLSVLAVVLVAALAVGAYFLYDSLKPETEVGAKSVTVIVTDTVNNTESKTFTYKTDALYLADLLLENKLASGTDGEYGLMLETVNGITADDAKYQFWGIYLDGEMTQYGASTQPVKDGDTFEIKLECWQ